MEGEVKENPEVKVDLNALSAPEGTDKENFVNFEHKEEPIEASSSKLYNLPNLDPPKETVENTEAEDPSKKDPAAAVPKVESPEKKVETQAGNDPWFYKPFKDLQKKLGLTDEEFKLPEGLTEENYLDKYNDFLYENTEFEGEDNIHPELKKINDLVNKGVDYKEAVAAYQRMNDLAALPDKELVALSLKQQFGITEERKDGWDENKINERISKMESSGYLEIEAQRLRDQIKEEKDKINSQYEESVRQRNEKSATETEKLRTQQIDKSLEYLSGITEVYGIPISKAEITEFKEDFKYLVTPNKETGVSPIMELLQSNENLVKIAYFLKKGDAKVREALTKAKESAKKSVIDKLDDEPQLPKKTAAPMNEGAIDLLKLTEPARD